MQNIIVTCDLSRFGYMGIDAAAKLLAAYLDNQNVIGRGVSLNLNTNSGNVFLCDEDYNVGMINDDDKLELFNSCPSCGAEGFASTGDCILHEDGCNQCTKI